MLVSSISAVKLDRGITLFDLNSESPDSSDDVVYFTDCSRKLGAALNVVGIIDPAIQPAEQVLAKKRDAGVAGYDNTQVFASLDDAAKCLTEDSHPRYIRSL